jgi:hypothetical protein
LIPTFAEHFRADNLFFPPDNQIFQTVFDGVFGKKPGVQGDYAVNQADIHIGVELAHLVEVHRWKQSVAPAESCVSIDYQVGGIFCFCDDVFEDAATK